jgi:curved DNA-binding protein CbpA
MPVNPLLDSLVILGLDETATWKEIKDARRDLSQIWHTDRFHTMNQRIQDRAEEQLKKINTAYGTLTQINERDFPPQSTATFSFKEEKQGGKEEILRRPAKKYCDPSGSLRFAKYSFVIAIIVGFISIPQGITTSSKHHFRFITPALNASRSPVLTGDSIFSKT